MSSDVCSTVFRPGIPLHSSRPGLRTLNKGECEYLFANSFYSLSGAMGTQRPRYASLACCASRYSSTASPAPAKSRSHAISICTRSLTITLYRGELCAAE